MPKQVTCIRDLAATVRGRRKELGLSQADVARSARVSRQWVSEFEAGKPRAELWLVIRLLDALGLNLSIDDTGSHQQLRPATPKVDLDDLLNRYRNG